MRAALLLAVFAASAAAAQPVTLRLWNVPPGARICETGAFTISMRTASPDTVRASDGTVTAVTCWDGFGTHDGRPVAAREVLVRQEDAGFENVPYTNPTLGDTLLLERSPDQSWAARLLHGQPTEEQQEVLRSPFLFALDDLYVPETPASVGDTWEIPASEFARVAGQILVRADAPYRYTVRLDSVGERAGRRVAYLFHDGTFTLAGQGTPARVHKTRLAAIDLETGVETWADQTYAYSFQYETTSARGEPGVVQFEMHKRSAIERTVEGPPGR